MTGTWSTKTNMLTVKRLFAALLIAAISLPLSAQNKSTSFEEYVKAKQAGLDAYKKKYEKDLYESMEAYLAYEKKYNEEYEAYKKKVMGMWGDDEMVDSTPKTWVDYSKDLTSRSNVDFEKGEVEIEVLVDVDQTEKDINKKLKEAVVDLVEAKDTLTGNTILKDQLEVKKEVVDTVKQEVKKVQTDNGEKKVVKIKMELAEDHLSVRAAQFKDIVKKNSDRFDIDQPLIYAVIEQESAFNPKAKSHAPAYGLMQLVPKSGGRDAFRHVHKRDVVPAPAYLYVPENNVELGTGYLNLLMTQTFAQVKDPQCRMLCAIAAYNTGAGNVSRAINGGRSVSKAVPAINAMSYDKLYSHLKRHLPHAETRSYIQKVTEKMNKYKK